MAYEIVLAGEQARLTLRISGYLKPEEAAGLGANLLAAEVEADVGSTGLFLARKAAPLHVVELKRFHDELSTAYRELSGRASISNIDSDFGATLELANGSGTLSGSVLEWGRRLSFEDVRTDQTYIGPALSQIQAVVNEFPVRPNPWD